MFSHRKFFVLQLIILIRQIKTDSEEGYYVKLITQNAIKSESYVLPKYYEEFRLKNPQQQPINIGYFDFIISGGGTGGLLAANRLSENRNWKILVLEAGGKGNNFTDIPGAQPFLIHSDYNWGYYTSKQKHICQETSNKKCIYPRGKCLGGTSVLNENVFARGTYFDYDRWSKLGLEGWSYNELLNYMKKYENATSLKNIDIAYHGFKGDLKLEDYRYISEPAKAYIQTLELHDYNLTDYNGKNPFGYGIEQQTTYRGRRQSSAKAFLDPVSKKRCNLFVMTKSLVTNIVIDGTSAKSVEFIYNGTKFIANVNKEVILSAGVVGSPQILMLSGIGPSEYLKELNISVINDLPVGKNYKEQLVTILLASTNFSIDSSLSKAVSEYIRGYGPLTSSSISDILAFQQIQKFSATELIFLDGFSLTLLNNTLEYINPLLIGVSNVLLHPKSTGTVRLKSKDPLDFPLIDPEFLTKKEDWQSQIALLNLSLSILESESLNKFNASVIKDTTHCKMFYLGSKDYWKCFIKYNSIPGYHGSGTCRMGINRTNSVVNDKLLVHGLDNLRVMDASVVPVTITGHMIGTVYTVAEKGTAIIKEKYNSSKNVTKCI